AISSREKVLSVLFIATYVPSPLGHSDEPSKVQFKLRMQHTTGKSVKIEPRTCRNVISASQRSDYRAV
ncbi:MAG: hypothetical protein ABJK87_02015, partial [Marinomonas sp.]